MKVARIQGFGSAKDEHETGVNPYLITAGYSTGTTPGLEGSKSGLRPKAEAEPLQYCSVSKLFALPPNRNRQASIPIS